MEKKMEVLPPPMPNTIYLQAPPTTKQTGINWGGSNAIDVGELTEEEAQEYAELMKQTFLKHWKHRSSIDLSDML